MVMPTPPRFTLAPEDLKWGRWVTERLEKLSGETSRAATNIKAATQGAASSAGAVAVTRVQVDAQGEQLEQVAETVDSIGDIIVAPAPPLPPTTPTLTTKLSTVTAAWDGLLDGGLDEEAEEPIVSPPISGFKAVIAELTTADPDDEDASPSWTQVGVGRPDAGGITFSRTVGEAVWVRLVAINYDGTRSEPSAPVSIIVEGVAKVDLDFEVQTTLENAEQAVVSTLAEYVVTDSATVPPGPGAAWSSDTPDWDTDQFVWRRLKNTHVDGTTSYNPPEMITGADGTPGEDAVLLRVSSSRGTSFKNNAISTVLTVTVFKGSTQITNITDLRAALGGSAFIEWWWRRMDDSDFGVISSADPRLSQAGFALTVSPADVDGQTVFQAILNT